MINDAQFTANTGIAIDEITPDVAPFTLFNIDLGGVVNHNPATGEKSLAFPHLMGVDLWEVKKIGKKGRKATVSQAAKKADVEATETARLAQLAKYVEQGFAFEAEVVDNPDGGFEVEESDEWDNFFGGCSPTKALACE